MSVNSTALRNGLPLTPGKYLSFISVIDFVDCYVTNRKVAGSRLDEVNDFYQVT
jgi:hypothetical protein